MNEMKRVGERENEEIKNLGTVVLDNIQGWFKSTVTLGSSYGSFSLSRMHLEYEWILSCLSTGRLVGSGDLVYFH